MFSQDPHDLFLNVEFSISYTEFRGVLLPLLWKGRRMPGDAFLAPEIRRETKSGLTLSRIYGQAYHGFWMALKDGRREPLIRDDSKSRDLGNQRGINAACESLAGFKKPLFSGIVPLIHGLYLCYLSTSSRRSRAERYDWPK
jgi:hypothetical protein